MRSRRKQKAERAGQRATPPSSRTHASTAPSGDQASADKPTPTRSSWTSARAHSWRRLFSRSKRGFDEKNAFPAIRTTLGHGSRFVRPTGRGTEPRSPPHVLSPRVGGSRARWGILARAGGSSARGRGCPVCSAASDVGAQVMAMERVETRVATPGTWRTSRRVCSQKLGI